MFAVYRASSCDKLVEQDGEGKPLETGDIDIDLAKRCVTQTFTSRGRLGPSGQFGAARQLGLGVPWVWVTMKYTLCCDSSGRIDISGSDFPSHAIYVNDNIKYHQDAVYDKTLADLAKFILSGGKPGSSNDAPGGHIATGYFRGNIVFFRP